MEDKKRTRILGIMCKGIAISLLVLYVSLAFFSFFIRFSFVCSFVSSYLVVFRPVWSYLVLSQRQTLVLALPIGCCFGLAFHYSVPVVVSIYEVLHR